MLEQDVIYDLISGLLSIFQDNVLRIILYGSVARREDRADSDIDIAIIVRNSMTSAVFNQFIAWNAELDMKYEKVFSIVDIEESKINQWGATLPFYRNIQTEGIVLWEAA